MGSPGAKTKTRISIAGRTDISLSKPPGFTLIELVAVIFLMTLGLSLVLGVNYRQRESFKLRSGGRQTFAFLNACRDLAVLSGRENVCGYAPATGRLFEATRNKTLALPEGVRVLRPEGLDPTLEENAAFPLAVFYADGSAESGTVWLSAGDKALPIELDPVLGSPKISRRLIPLTELPEGVDGP